MQCFTTTSAASRLASDCIIVGVYEKNELGSAAAEVDAASDGEISRHTKEGDISGRCGATMLLSSLTGVRAKRVLVVGLGKKKAFGIPQFRQACQAAINRIKESKAKDVVNFLTLEEITDSDPYYLARYAVESAGNALYSFDEMKSKKKKRALAIKKLGLALKGRSDESTTKLGAKHAQAIVEGMSLAQELGNLPANVCTPSYLARQAQKIARRFKSVTTKVLGEADIRKLGMHAFLSVTGGAKEPAKLIVMQYKGAAKKKPIVLVGKGITFDAGGISLKPVAGMDEMKFDMCGAASVIATLQVAAMLKLPINLNVVVPSCENLPSGTATRPGDIIKSMSGQTIEILNTDAEGRLLLCDAITYARRFKPSVMIDVATLTGACVIALGHHYTAIMSRDDKLANEIKEAGVAADDRGWPMPIDHRFEKQLRSNFADFANVGAREGGAITAACFLGKFTAGLDWAHLDIAGTAWRAGPSKGATGRPVPMLSEFLLRRSGALN